MALAGRRRQWRRESVLPRPALGELLEAVAAELLQATDVLIADADVSSAAGGEAPSQVEADLKASVASAVDGVAWPVDGEAADAVPSKTAEVVEATKEALKEALSSASTDASPPVELDLKATVSSAVDSAIDRVASAVKGFDVPGPEGVASMAQSTMEVLEETKDALKAAGEKAVSDVLDAVSKVSVDTDTEDEFWDLGNIPFLGPTRILRKRTSDTEVALTGLVAGGVIELGRVLLLHPIDTVKTRLQVPGAGWAALRPQRLFDGVGPAVATVPLCALFWAVKDVVRRRIVGLIPLPIWHDVLSTTIASAVGEMAYWAARTPSELLKTREQAELIEEVEAEEEEERQQEEAEGGAPVPAPARTQSERLQARESAEAEEKKQEGEKTRPRKKAEKGEEEVPLWQESLNSFPVLALSDVPNVTLRTGIFVLLHGAPGTPTGIGADALLFAVAATLAALVSTPLDVARTRLLLNGHTVEELPETILTIGREEGLEGLMAGWLPRTLWNGLVVGVAIGLVRQGYSEVRALFLLDVLDQLEDFATPLLGLPPH